MPQPSASRIRSFARWSTGFGMSSKDRSAANSARRLAGVVSASGLETESSMMGHRFGLRHVVDETAVTRVECEGCGAARRGRAARIGAQAIRADFDDVFDVRPEIHAADDLARETVLSGGCLRRRVVETDRLGTEERDLGAAVFAVGRGIDFERQTVLELPAAS